MPYYVKNVIELKGIANMPIFTSTIRDKDKKELVCFDFDKLIPMPESLDIEAGTIETVAIDAFLRNTEDYHYAGKVRLALTDEQYRQRLVNCGRTEEELIKLGSQYIFNKLNYGHRTWHDWRWYNWGSKSKGYNVEFFGPDMIGFYTLNGQPTQIFLKLIELNPDTDFECWWAGEEYGHRTGHISNRDGVTIMMEYEDCSDEAIFASSYCWDDTFRKESKTNIHCLTKAQFNKKIEKLYNSNYFS